MNKLINERKTIYHMIEIYCHNHHKKSVSDCNKCNELWMYASKRLDNCPYQEAKPNCKKCPIHCYNEDMRKYVKDVMAYSGPRMMLKHPILTVIHLRNALKK